MLLSVSLLAAAAAQLLTESSVAAVQPSNSVVRDIVRTTAIGQYEGRRYTFSYRFAGALTDVVDRFTSIPFAKPPVGQLRFEKPQPVPVSPASALIKARASTLMCWNFPEDYGANFIAGNKDLMGEDCLYLNIYVPHLPKRTEKLPVMVFVHGGSYQMNTGVNYTGYTLSRFGVILVSVNYRLGPFGFLTSGTDEIEGNFGLWDQVEALRWVNKNIVHFGGDNKRVTIVGHSAGAASVDLLNIAEPAKGLFQSVISQSGSSQSYFAIYPKGENFPFYFKQIMKVYGCDGPGSYREQKECMKQVPFEVLIDAENFKKLPAFDGRDTSWRPRVDGKLLPLGRSGHLLLDGERMNAQRLMSGFTRNEITTNSAYFVAHDFSFEKQRWQEDQRSRALAERAMNITCSIYFRWPAPVCTAIDEMYKSDMDNRSHNFTQVFFDTYNDYVMVAPTLKVVKAASLAKKPTFAYLFNYFPNKTNIPWWHGVRHGTELDYLFGYFHTGIKPEPSDTTYADPEHEKERSIYLQGLWTNFVKTGSPNGKGRVEEWSEYSVERDNIAVIDGTSLHMTNFYRKDKVIFWNQIMPALLKWHTNGVSGEEACASATRFKTALIVVLIIIAVVMILFLGVIAWRRRRKRSEMMKKKQRKSRATTSDQNGLFGSSRGAGSEGVALKITLSTSDDGNESSHNSQQI